MTTYFVVNADIKDLDLLNEYQAAAGPTLAGREFTLVAASNDAEALEGKPAGSRVVILGFPDKAALMDWYNSEAYQAIIGKRFASTEGFGVIVEGF